MLELLEGRGVKPWEGWCVEFEVLGEAQGSRSRATTAAEECASLFSVFVPLEPSVTWPS